jgi:excisionase family DNA binding protein
VMRVASRLHDVGKIATPDAILLKPGPLTPDERDEMKRHAAIGHRMLRGSGIELLDSAAVIAWTHHERYDGTGYPRGLAGADIPLVGLIASVGDVFDALTTDRVYRRAMPVEDAVVVLRSQRGQHFDPVVLDAFLDELGRVREIMARFRDELPDHREATPTSGELLSLRDAANALAISKSQLRRWSDTGRIETERTQGGHRRFPVAAVRALADRRGISTRVRPIAPPAEPLPVLAEVLAQRGPQLVSTATGALYRGGEAGWFAAEHSAAARAEWLMALARGSRSGRYARAFRISDELLHRACMEAVGLLERYSFLELFGRVAVRELATAGAAHRETAAARRLFIALQQAHLDRHS